MRGYACSVVILLRQQLAFLIFTISSWGWQQPTSGEVAQLVEQQTFNLRVAGSIPVFTTNNVLLL